MNLSHEATRAFDPVVKNLLADKPDLFIIVVFTSQNSFVLSSPEKIQGADFDM